LLGSVSTAPTKIENQPAPSKRSRSVLVAVVIVLAAVAAGLWIMRGAGTEVASSPDRETGGTLHLDTFVLNLSDPGQRSYLRVGIDLGLSRPLEKTDAPPLGPLRDTIISVLGQARADDLVTAEGKTKLKQDLLQAVQKRVPGLGVVEVYFTEFLIQR
jgi:flagellar protein FliL